MPAAPASTLVSSPAQKSAGRRKGKAVANYDDFSDEDFGTSGNGYSLDGFVVDNADSDDEFQQMALPMARRRRMDPVGPPISRDARLSEENLSEIQKDILEAFFKEAQTLEEKVRVSKNHRQPIFSQLHIREMGLRWTDTLDKMRRIPNINRDAVDRYGEKLLPLIRRYHQRYQEIMGETPEPRTLPHLGEIVDLVTSDEDEDEDDGMEGIEDVDDDVDDDDDDDDEEDEDGETSGYFEPPAGELAWFKSMESLKQTSQQDHQSTTSRSRKRTSGGDTGSRGKGAWRGGSKKQRAPRRSSGNKFAGVKKKAAGTTSRRGTSGQPTTRGSGASSSRGGSASASTRGRKVGLQAFGFDGIGLMDH